MCSNRLLFLFAALFNVCLGQMEKSSLTFVIDDTGSMGDDIDQVKQGVNLVVDTIMNSNASQIKNLVFFTFNNVGLGSNYVSKTASREDFKAAFARLKVHEGGDSDCPKMAMRGIEQALMWSSPGSYLYVITDASAKDADQLDEVRANAIREKCQIVFLLTGRCSQDDNDLQYQAYYQLAEATSGQVFHMKKQEIGQIMKYVAETVKSRKSLITSRSFPPGYGHNISLAVDEDMKTIVIAESGKDPKIDITAPDGSTPNSTKIVDLPNVLTLRIDNTEPGIYTIVFGSKSETSVVVTASTTIQFKHGFSGAKATAIGDTATRPVPGEKTYLSIQLIAPENDKFLRILEIMDIDENIIMTLPLIMVNKKDTLYSTEDFDPPKFTFKIAIKGIDKKTKTEFRRMGLTPIEVQPRSHDIFNFVDPSGAYVERIANGSITIEAEYDKPLRISCKVRGYPKPDVVWSDSAGGKYTKPVSTIELPYDYISVLEIDRVTNNATYTCTASNIYRNYSESVDVKTIRKLYFKVIEVPEDIIVDPSSAYVEWVANVSISIDAEYDKPLRISCKVRGYPKPDVVWSDSAGRTFTTPVSTIEHPYEYISVLEIDRVTNNATYTCTASNIYRNYSKSVDVKTIRKMYPKVIKVLADIFVDPSSAYVERVANGSISIDAEYDKPLRISCKVRGYPKPDVVWSDSAGGTFTTPVATIEHPYDYISVLEIDRVTNNATYTCTASNIYRNYSKSVDVKTIRKMYFKVIEVPEAVIDIVYAYVEIANGNKIDAEYDKPLRIVCKVRGYPKPDVVWSDSAGRTFTTPLAAVELPYDYISVLKIDRVTNNATYTCTATNIYRNYSESIDVKTIRKGYFNVIEVPEDTTIEYLRSGSVTCKVDAFPPAKIKWLINGTELYSDDYIDISADKSVLTVKDMRAQLNRQFVCEANNERENKTFPFKIRISGFEKPKIAKLPLRLYVNKGDHTEISCRIVAGSPKPIVAWYFRPKDSRSFSKLNETDEVVRIKDLDVHHAGGYMCYVSNDAGQEIRETILIIDWPFLHPFRMRNASKANEGM